jgi:hypothetical protein
MNPLTETLFSRVTRLRQRIQSLNIPLIGIASFDTVGRNIVTLHSREQENPQPRESLRRLQFIVFLHHVSEIIVAENRDQSIQVLLLGQLILNYKSLAAKFRHLQNELRKANIPMHANNPGFPPNVPELPIRRPGQNAAAEAAQKLHPLLQRIGTLLFGFGHDSAQQTAHFNKQFKLTIPELRTLDDPAATRINTEAQMR